MTIGEEASVPVGKTAQVLLGIQRMVLAICAAGHSESAFEAGSTHGFMRRMGRDVCLNAGLAEWLLVSWDFTMAAASKCQIMRLKKVNVIELEINYSAT